MANFKPQSLILLFFFILIFSAGYGQETNKYAIFFTDKANSSFSLDHPEEFMSEKAINRRSKFNIPIVENDLPVSQDYIIQLEDKGYTYISKSNWLNAVLVVANELIDENILEEEEYIKDVLWVSQVLEGGRNDVSVDYSTSLFFKNQNNFEYGFASPPIIMMNGEYLHQQGWRGEDMVIGVLDAGFSNVPNIDAFQPMIQENRLLDTYDFVEYDDETFESSGHGTAVLSLMAGNVEGQFLGTAPKANYVLIRTEDIKSEQLVEEFNYVLGLEYADQLGVDVINTSLGYTRFNHDTMDHQQDDLDGDHLIASVGADIGASKGMLIINSAGNLGNSDWQYLSIPADGDSVLAVGSVNIHGQRSIFS